MRLETPLSRSNNETPTVSILIPAYKEEEYIEETLRGIVEAFQTAKITSEILVVLDIVADDQTASYVRRAATAHSEIRVIERFGRRGVGDAIMTGIKQARGKVVIPVMGDMTESPSDIVRLARRAEEFDIVFTDRFRNGRPPGYPVSKYIANRLCNLAAMLLFRIPYSDTTNAFKAYKKELLDCIRLSSKGFEIFLELPVKAMAVANGRTDVIEVDHRVRKKETPKLSIARDGFKYVHVLLSLLTSMKLAQDLNDSQ